MGTAFGDFGKLTDAFTAAAIDSSRWDAAMDVAAEATGSFGALMQPLRARMASVPVSKSIRPLMEPYVQEGWVERDERYRSVPALMRRGSACDLDYTTVEEMAHSPFYQDGLIRHGLQWYGGVRVGETGDLWGLALQRTPAQGPFLSAELARLAILSHSLAGAAELAQAFGFARMEAALAAFETSGSPVAAVDRYGAVVRLNASAERLLGSDLAIVRRRIASFDHEATAALDRALHKLLWAREPEALRPAVVLPRRAGRPILAYASRFSGQVHDAFSACSGFVVFADLDARRQCSEGELARAFGLTRAETRLANALLREVSLEAAAARLGVSLVTARNQLQAVFQKTDTHGQGQLVGLLARLAKANAY
jgi:PAS domain-containing protein